MTSLSARKCLPDGGEKPTSPLLGRRTSAIVSLFYLILASTIYITSNHRPISLVCLLWIEPVTSKYQVNH